MSNYMENMAKTLTDGSAKSWTHAKSYANGSAKAWDNKKGKTCKRHIPRGGVYERLRQLETLALLREMDEMVAYFASIGIVEDV